VIAGATRGGKNGFTVVPVIMSFVFYAFGGHHLRRVGYAVCRSKMPASRLRL